MAGHSSEDDQVGVRGKSLENLHWTSGGYARDRKEVTLLEMKKLPVVRGRKSERLRLYYLVRGKSLEGVSRIHDERGVLTDQVEVKRRVVRYKDHRILCLKGLSRQG